MEREGEKTKGFFFCRTDFSQLDQHLFLLQVFFKWWLNKSYAVIVQLPYISLGVCGKNSLGS